MDRDRFPQWVWLLAGLVVTSLAANLLNVVVLGPAGLPQEYFVATVIGAMAPVLVFLGVWFNDERAHYWDHSRVRIGSDLVFVVVGAALGAAIVLVALTGGWLPTIVRDIVAMTAGFVLGWGLFWFRNTDLYRTDEK
jgi:O-antigen/teichoic acid export membrane protein